CSPGRQPERRSTARISIVGDSKAANATQRDIANHGQELVATVALAQRAGALSTRGGTSQRSCPPPGRNAPPNTTQARPPFRNSAPDQNPHGRAPRRATTNQR